MKNYRIRTDAEVIDCGKLVADGCNVYEVEKQLTIPHSTVHWVILNRLEFLDEALYKRCLSVFHIHKHTAKRGRRKNDRTISIATSN